MSKNQIFAGLTNEQIAAALDNLCTKKEKQTYTRTLTSEELLADEKSYIRKQMDLQRLGEEAKESNDNYKAKIKALEQEQEESLKRIKNQKRDVVGILYSIPNQVEGMMQMYDSAGELIDERPLKAEERQTNIMLDGPGGPALNEVQDVEILDDSAPTLDEAIDQMNEGEPNIAGMASGDEKFVPEGFEELEAENPTPFPEGRSDEEILNDEGEKEQLPADGKEEDWDEFEQKKQEELAAKAGTKTGRKKKSE